MSERESPRTNLEYAHLMTGDAAIARRQAALWQKPALPDREIPDAVGIPPSLWAQCKSDGDTPPLFQIGRRLFVRTSDLKKWLDDKARDARPGSKRLRRAAQDEPEAA